MVSATSYVACGSSDESRTDQEAGATGAGGDDSNSGGSQNAAGSSNVAGTMNSGGGDTSSAGAPSALGGEGGLAGSTPGGSGGAASLGGHTGEAGAAGTSPDASFPAACPGVREDYTQVDGTDGTDTFSTEQLTAKTLVFGFAGDDVFERNHDGNDCLVGGPGDDDLTNPGEAASYLIGGPGADTFHLTAQTNNYALIIDMSSEDTIGLSLATFNFLDGGVGAVPASYQLFSLADYEAGTGSIPGGEGAALVYDPATGGIWRDTDRGVKGPSPGDAVQIATVVNHAGYTFDLNDFVIED